MKTLNKSKVVFALLLLLILNACNDSRYEAKSPNEAETVNSGKLEIYIDDSYKKLMDTVIKQYEQQFKNVALTSHYASSRETMSMLLAGRTRAVISARDYLPDEDSLMQIYKVTPHYKFIAAYDALVFFAKKDFPSDTANVWMFEDYLQNKDIDLSLHFPFMAKSSKLNTNQANSSEYANLLMKVGKGKQQSSKVKNFNSIDSLKEFVYNNRLELGVAYLSQINKDDRFKMLRLAFKDSLGNYVAATKPVHQSYVLQDLYPYKLPIYVYLLENRQNLPFWFGTFVAKETRIQEYYLKSGIVPAFAKIKLKFEE